MCVLWYVLIGIGGFFFVKQKTAYEMRISDWSSDVCSSDLLDRVAPLCRDVLVECTAERHVDDLETPAEPEERLPLRDRPAGELELDPVARPDRTSVV